MGDRDGLFAFGQLVSTLHDETSNVLVIPCVQSSFATELKDKSRGADYDRMTSLGARSLATLTRSQAEKLIAARLPLAGPGFMPSPTADALWPLDPTDFPRLAAVDELTPRRLLATCADRFEVYLKQASSPAVIDVPSADQPADDATVIESSADSFLDDEWKSRVEQALAASRPERTEEIVRHGLPQLARLLSPHWKPVRDEQLPDIPLVFEEPSGARTGVSICTQANMNSVTALLKRLKTQFTPDRLGRLIVLRDGRVPLSKTAKVASQSLEQLVQQGAVVAEHSAEVYAALDALRELISESKAGDLSRDGQTVLPDTVEKWLCQHLPVGLRDFVDSIFGESSSAGDSLPLESLATLLSERPIVPLAEVAAALNSTEATVVALIQRHPDRARLLMGPPAVVFRVDGDALS